MKYFIKDNMSQTNLKFDMITLARLGSSLDDSEKKKRGLTLQDYGPI